MSEYLTNYKHRMGRNTVPNSNFVHPRT